MIELLKIILSLSLSGALLTLVILLCKPFVKDKFSKRWQYYIWLIVVARLLLPFAPETNFVGTIFQHFESPAVQMDTSPQLEQDYSTPSKIDLVPSQTGSDGGQPGNFEKLPLPSASGTAKQQAAVICLLVWLIVAVGLLIRKITVYQSFVKYIKAGRIAVSDLQLWECVGNLVEQSGAKRAVELYTNSLISSPLLIGFFRPCIMLPTIELSESDFKYTILHELTHYKRRDMFYKWLVQVAICLHWFNPLVYIMGREVNRACELSCDEAVITSLDTGGRRAYGDTLLNAIGTGGAYKNSLASVTLSENAELLKERLDAIMKSKNNGKVVAIFSVLLAILIFIGGFALGAYSEKPDWEGTTPGQMTDEGLPVMSAKNRNLYEAYVAPISVTGLLYRNFSPEDVSSLLTEDGTTLLCVLHALNQEQIEEFDGALPAKFVEENLLAILPLEIWNIKDACASVYDEATDTYTYTSGLGGGPAVPIVMESRQDGKIITLRYTWYLGDPAEDAFRYTPGNSGELIIEVNKDGYRYISNKLTVIRGSAAGVPSEYSSVAYPPSTDTPEPADAVDPVKLAAERMQAGQDIYWCYYGMDYEGLQIDQESEVLQSDDGGTYRRVGRFATMSELKNATEAVFTKSFCEYNLYPHITENNLFREIDGVLGYSTQAGGIGGFYALPYTYTLKSEKDDRILLSAACLGMDEQAYTFDLVLVKEDGAWKLDTYYNYTATGYTGDLPLLH